MTGQPDTALLDFVGLALDRFPNVHVAWLRTPNGELGLEPVDECLARGGVVALFIPGEDFEPEKQLPDGWKLRGKQP